MANQNRAGAAASPYHHGSHRHLLKRGVLIPRTAATVDAIIVPTARRGANLQTAINLAAQLGCTLVALCSKWAKAQDAARRARRAGIELVAIDINVKELPVGLMPTFDTTNLLASSIFARRTDTSIKRNLGLLLANLIGWDRIIFLDDDIEVPEPNHLRNAARLLDSYPSVGLTIGGFPDNSVVCHAYRLAGGPQEAFIGGGALAVRPSWITSFFPDIYNEDWFFLLDNDGLRRSAVTGRVVQQPYEPFRDDSRARTEEFGDCLAEGLFWLLDNQQRVQDADANYWRRFLQKRLVFITEVIGMVLSMDTSPAEKQRMVVALKAARGRCEWITPSLCVDYLEAWRADRDTWRTHITDLRTEHLAGKALVKREHGSRVLEPEKALSGLGLMGWSRYVPRTSLPSRPGAAA